MDCEWSILKASFTQKNKKYHNCNATAVNSHCIRIEVAQPTAHKRIRGKYVGTLTKFRRVLLEGCY